MREKKWTPGPWMIAGKEETTVYSLGPMGTTVFWCGIQAAGKESASEEECKANARLIAAAPDLVEALEGLARMHRERFGLDGAYDTEIRVAEDALAKAYGETNHD